jgi:hypothetical protein
VLPLPPPPHLTGLSLCLETNKRKKMKEIHTGRNRRKGEERKKAAKKSQRVQRIERWVRREKEEKEIRK